MSLVPNIYLKSTVQILLNWNGHGSWFIYGYKIWKQNDLGQDLYNIYLVTNFHVVNVIWELAVTVNTKDWVKKAFNFDGCQKDREKYILQEGIDIAILPLNSEFLKSENIDIAFFQEEFSINSKEEYLRLITSGHDIFLLWYSLWLNWENINSPLVRQWIVSRYDKECEWKNLIYFDVNNFPWNSWWPIITRPEIYASDWENPINESKLIWIINAYIPQQNTYFDISNCVPQARMVFTENSWIALWIPIFVVHNMIKDKLIS